MKKVLILGATSAIATATARMLVSSGHALFLAARNEPALRALADDLRTRGAQKVETIRFDATAVDTHKDLVEAAAVALGGLDTAILAYGSLPDQIAIQDVPERVIAELETNFTSMASLLTILATQFERQGHGTIVAISSVAGDRGRAVNYVYGSAKAGLTCFLSGLRQRLWRKGVEVITIKPGLVNTPMTARFRRGLLWSSPESIAKGVVRAIEVRKAIVYLPGFWRLIMAGIRLLPEGLFIRLRL